MTCTAKHTPFQPSDAEFNCPKCGEPAGEFHIDEPAAGASDDCEKLHKGDVLICCKCGYGTTGGAYAKAQMRRRNLVPCPHCKGTGLTKKQEPKATPPPAPAEPTICNHVCVDDRTQMMRCNVCGDEVPMPLGDLRWCVAVMDSFTNAHRTPAHQPGRTWFAYDAAAAHQPPQADGSGSVSHPDLLGEVRRDFLWHSAESDSVTNKKLSAKEPTR